MPLNTGRTEFEHANVWQTPEYGYSPILVAARLLPMGLVGLLAGVLVNAFPAILSKPKYTILVGYGGKSIVYTNNLFVLLTLPDSFRCASNCLVDILRRGARK